MIKKIKEITLKKVLIFFCFLFSLFLIDWLTKTFLFDISKKGIITHENDLFGIRSIDHKNSTFFSSIDFETPIWLSDLLFFLILTILLVVFVYVQKTASIIGLAFIISGVLGNGLDMLIFQYVRDIIFTPWMDRGTFNFSDLFVIIGSIIFIISFVLDLSKNKKNKEIKEGENEKR